MTADSKNKRAMTAAQIAFAMMILTLISKGIGFIREMIIAAFFGTGYVVDAYVMAQSIPSMILAGVLSAVSTSFMPLFSEKNEREGSAAGDRFVNEVLNLMTKVAVVMAIFGITFSPYLVRVFAGGFNGEQAALTAFFLRITFLYLIFQAANGLLTKYLNYKGTFLAPIAFGYAQNFFVITFVIIAAYFNEKLIVFGLLCSQAALYVLLRIVCKKWGFSRKFSLKNSGIAKQIVALALPTFIGGYVSTINTYVDRTLASGLAEGSVSALSYANIIISFITGLTVSIISAIVFPKLNQARAQGDMEHYNEMLSTGFNLLAIISIPFGLGALAFSQEAVQVIYERGAFNTGSTAMTGTALFWYGAYLCFSSMNQQSIYAFQTNKDMKTPMYIGVVSVTVNVCLNLLLVDVMGIAGLAFATSIAAGVSLVLSMLLLRKKYPQLRILESGRKLLMIAASAGVSVLAARYAYNGIAAIIWMPRICYLAVAMLLAGVMYLMLLKLFRVKELELLKLLVRR